MPAKGLGVSVEEHTSHRDHGEEASHARYHNHRLAVGKVKRKRWDIPCPDRERKNNRGDGMTQASGSPELPKRRTKENRRMDTKG